MTRTAGDGDTGADLVLASSSPRRAELLARLGLQPRVRSPRVDERWHPAESAEAYVLRLAVQKAAAVALQEPRAVVLAADTAVVLDGEPLGKPRDAEDARAMLGRLSGRTHEVLTAVAVQAPGEPVASALDRATVSFVAMSDALVDWYVATGEPRDKAGAYAVQGAGAVLVERLVGDPTTVVGLPLRLSAAMLATAGLPVAH